MDNVSRRFLRLMILLVMWHVLAPALGNVAEGVETGFSIKVFEVTGNTIFPDDRLNEAVAPFIGPGKTAADVEKARDAIEKLYHDAGYPAVMVNIPEQTVKDGVVILQVVESRIGRVKITGNRYFTQERIMSRLPSLAPGEMLYLPGVQREISSLNANPDLKVSPSMSPGRELGTIDLDLKVEDRLPLHGYLELNNRSSSNTKELRLNGMIRYDNLWQADHSVALQYQTAPQSPKEVQVVGASYVLPAPWRNDDQMAFYGIWSDSETAFGEGFNVVGKGQIFGVRYVIPLPQYRLYAHNITLGLDYKHFNQAVGYTTTSGETTDTPVTYMPLSVSYSASLADDWGATQFSGGLNMSFRGVVSNQDEFELKRYKASANYIYATLGVQRNQKLPWDMSLFLKIDGQISDQPLIDNEQYSAGGMESVRGYKESEALGDNALHGTVEVTFPNPLRKSRVGGFLQMSPFLFYDVAGLTIRDPLPARDSIPAQARSITLEGAGAGIRGSRKNLEYEVDWAMALHSTESTNVYDQRVYFKVRVFL